MYLFSTLASATTLYIGPGMPQPTLAQGVNAASSGDTLVLLPGSYTADTLSITGELTIRGLGGHAVTTIFVTGFDDGFVVDDGELTVEHVTFEMDGYNRAIYADWTSELTLDHVVMRDGGMVTGACLYSEGDTIVRNSRFEDCIGGFNFGALPAGGGIAQDGGEIEIDGTTFEGNDSYSGGAFLCDGFCDVRRSLFVDNSANYGGAIYNQGVLSLSTSRLCENTAGEGGAIKVRNSNTQVDHSVFWDNTATGNGGAVAVEYQLTTPNPFGSVHTLWGYNTGVGIFQGGEDDVYSFSHDIIMHHTTIFGNPPGAYTNDWIFNSLVDYENTNGIAVTGNTFTNRIFDNPLLVLDSRNTCAPESFMLQEGSSAIDAGTDADADGTAGDLGPFGGPDAWTDVDGDGVFAPEDCDDDDADVFPGAPEACNGIDNDCDGLIDNGIGSDTYYFDQDADGYGAGAGLELCAPLAGTVLDGGDCDDADPAISPAATELCNGLDENCDGVLDDGLATTAFHTDDDGDGYGAGNPIQACAPPPGTVADDTDCDDSDSDIHPTAVERCNLEDDDCDGQADEDAVDLIPYFSDLDLDGFGSAVLGEACTLPAGTSGVGTDCDDTNENVFPGAHEVCNGIDDDCDTAIDDNPIDTQTLYTDNDGDGYGVGAPLDTCPGDGLVSVDGDCDDGNGDVNPGATEVPDNGRDDDCVDGDATGSQGDPDKPDGCSVVTGAPSWMLLVPLLGVLGRRR